MNIEMVIVGIFFFIIIVAFIAGMFFFPEIFGISRNTESDSTTGDDKKEK